jgi:hypothetical protein
MDDSACVLRMPNTTTPPRITSASNRSIQTATVL